MRCKETNEQGMKRRARQAAVNKQIIWQMGRADFILFFLISLLPANAWCLCRLINRGRCPSENTARKKILKLRMISLCILVWTPANFGLWTYRSFFQSRGSDAEFQLELRIQPSGCNFVRPWPISLDYLPHLGFWLDSLTPFTRRPSTHSLAHSWLRMLTSSTAATVKLNSVAYLQQGNRLKKKELQSLDPTVHGSWDKHMHGPSLARYTTSRDG